jgi:integrase
MKELVPSSPYWVPRLVAAASEQAASRFLEFFAANIRNVHTRRAYMRATLEFLELCEAVGVASIADVTPSHVATYIEKLTKAHSVRGPSHRVKRGKTPVLDASEARALIDDIDVTTTVGLRDRALIGLMVYSFARIGAGLAMKVDDVYVQNRRLWVRLHEKGGKRHEMPCHHNLETHLHAYIDGCGLGLDPKGPLFRTIGRGTGQLTETALPQPNAYQMILRRAAAAGIATKIGNHSFRATGITAYLKKGGTLEKAAAVANHASTRTAQLYDRRSNEISLDEVERVAI